MKKCKKCGIEKELSHFYIHKKMGDGHLNFCKNCVKNRIHSYWKDGRGKLVDKKRQKTLKRKKWAKEYSKLMRRKYYKKYRARWIFWEEFIKNDIKKLPCEECKTSVKIEAHHPDYNKPLEVVWLCSLHHKKWHKNNKAIEPF